MRPYDAKNDDAVLSNDNIDVGNFWMLTDGYTVSLAEQQAGSVPDQHISIPRDTFNKMIDWYMREQSKSSTGAR